MLPVSICTCYPWRASSDCLASAGVGTTIAGLATAGTVGYGAGTLANMGINAGLSKYYGRERSLGTIFAESSLGKWLSGVDIDEEAIAKSMAAIKPPEPPPSEVDIRQQIDLAPGLILTSQTMHATGSKVQMDTGNMMTGAPH